MQKNLLKFSLGVLAIVLAITVAVSINDAKKTTKPTDVPSTSVENTVTEPTEYYNYASGSQINDVDISGMTVSEAINAVKEDFLSKEILVETPFGRKVFSYDMLSCDFSALEELVNSSCPNESKTEISFNPILCVDFENTDFLQVFGKDEEIVESKDATLVVDIENGTVSVQTEIYGNIPKTEVITELLTNAVNDGLQEILLTEDDYEGPTVCSTDEKFVEDKTRLEKILQKKISLGVCGYTITISSKQIRGMLKYDGEISVDESAVAEYVDKLKNKYDTCGVDREFKTSTGKTVTITKGTYGWTIDKQGTIDKITNAILNDKKRPSINTAYSVKGQRPSLDELQGSYIEVSLADQHIWMYKDGVRIVDDDCTTGEWNKPSCHTREGMFYLRWKKRDVVLKGSDYADFVNYWMPYDKSIGLHDASWRTDEEFGGTNYIGNGSHGCVNLRHDTAETIYNNWDKDVPIIVW